MPQMERTFVIVKPDGVQRQLAGKIVSTFERRGLKIVGLKLLRITPELAGRHYAEHRDKPFFQGLVDFITSGPVVAMVLEGKDCIAMVRGMMGATDPLKAAPDSRPTAVPRNDLGAPKYDLTALCKRVKKYFSGPPAANPRLINYLAAGNVHGLRPLRKEKRIARNRFLTLALIFVAVLFGIFFFLARPR